MSQNYAEVGGEEADEQQRGFATTVTQKMDGLRNWMASHCCEFIKDIPSIVFLIALCLLLALLLALIPLLFLLLGSSVPEAQRLSDMQIIRTAHVWPGVDPLPSSAVPRGDLDDELGGLPLLAYYPPKVSTCQGYGFTCTNEPNKVISSSLRCDGHPDCPDNSDEINCRTCQTPFSCPYSNSTRNLICLTAAQLCDNVEHCFDSSDERDFCRDECDIDEHKCGMGQKLCLPMDAVCDGVKDCKDGSDEQQCEVCTRGAKKCDNKCVAAGQLCDGNRDCIDGADEEGCDCRACSGSSVALCSDGTCISRDKVCDGQPNCADGMDEDSCPGSCSVKVNEHDMILCSKGRLYPLEEACRGEIDECAYNCTQCNPVAAHTCSDDGKCIAQSMICDGNKDCKNGEDEQNCNDACDDSTAFKCLKSTKCIPAEQRCDGVWHCKDHSDEEACEQCPENSIKCGLDCVPNSARCDGIVHCKDGTDEANCSCDECLGAHSNTYMCQSSGRCLSRLEVCAPYSTCPNATHVDRLYCARLALPPFFNL